MDFIWQYLSEHGDKIQFKHKFAQVVLHIDCASQKLANNAKIMHILSYCATKVITLNEIVCCGFAGTKGYTVPELNAAMLSGLSAHVAECDCGVTLNANCAIGLTHHSQIPYYTLSQLLLRCL